MIATMDMALIAFTWILLGLARPHQSRAVPVRLGALRYYVCSMGVIAVDVISEANIAARILLMISLLILIDYLRLCIGRYDMRTFRGGCRACDHRWCRDRLPERRSEDVCPVHLSADEAMAMSMSMSMT